MKTSVLQQFRGQGQVKDRSRISQVLDFVDLHFRVRLCIDVCVALRSYLVLSVPSPMHSRIHFDIQCNFQVSHPTGSLNHRAIFFAEKNLHRNQLPKRCLSVVSRWSPDFCLLVVLVMAPKPAATQEPTAQTKEEMHIRTPCDSHIHNHHHLNQH